MKLFLTFSLALAASTLLPAQVVLFPGDLNNDGTANHIDLLALGLAYGQEGPPREFFTPDWVPQEGPPWPQQLPLSGVNYGFIDANGDGRIDSLDIELIPFNYDSLQAAAFPPPQPYILPDTFFTTAPPRLQLRFSQDTAGPGDTVSLIVEYIVPDPTVFPPEALPLGIAFSLNGLDELPIIGPIAIFPDTLPGDLLFVAATEETARFWRSVVPGQVEFAAAGKGMGALGFSRPLAEMLIIIEDMIIPLELPIKPDSVLLINTREQLIALEIGGDTLLLNSRQAPWPPSFARVFPNPARHALRVETERPMRLGLTLYSPAGQAVRREQYGIARQAGLNTAGLAPGMYFLEIRSEEGLQVERVVLER